MATLVYKMTHKGDPDSDLGLWGVEDCMGQVRDYGFDAVIGIGGRSWWRNQTNRTGEVVWIGIGPEVVDQSRRGPVLRFARFRYFREGEVTLKAIAPNLERAMHNRRFMLHGFTKTQEDEIARIRKLAENAGPSAQLNSQEADAQAGAEGGRCKVRRRTRCGR